MTRALFLAAILAGRFVQGETKPVERYVIAPLSVLALMIWHPVVRAWLGL
jgi:hypothetical protein